jgi:hypothetical protein
MLGASAMAVDIREIELTDEQKRRVAQIAELSGRPWRDVLDDVLDLPGDIERMKPSWTYKDRYIEDYDQWRAYFEQWLSRRRSYNPNFDDSRESIYPDRT